MLFNRTKNSPCILLGILLLFTSSANCVETFYDFIVVGSGAGGGCVSRRLAEHGKFKVLLIEAGGVPKEGYDIPAHAPSVAADRDLTFRFQSVPQKNVALKYGGVIPITAGKMLGGTTSMNLMFFNRGARRDWNNFAEVTGDDSWNYKNLLKYFKRSENYLGDFPSSMLHGSNGPITVSRPRYAPGLYYWLAAGRELGYPVVDPNGFENMGFSPVEFAKRHGRRVSSFSGYLEPALQMPNLHILMNTNVTQVILQGKKAVGVRLVSAANNLFNESVVYASKEVIISAGAYFSPIILQRSGIGPRSVLQTAKIPIVTELPVGKGLQAHNSVNLNFAINNPSVIFDEVRDLTPTNLEIYNAIGDGPFSNTRGAVGQAFTTSSIARAEGNADWPDIQLIMCHSSIPFFTHDPIHVTARNNMSLGEVPMSIAVYVGRPKSRGSVRLNPENPLKEPLVDFGFFSDARDYKILLEGIRDALRVYEQTYAYSSLRARFIPLALPACDKFPVKSPDYWICYARQLIPSACHPAGTNKMGKRNDSTAVVDNELRVIGIDNLRIVDASVMPNIVYGNPQAAIYAIAEKAADMILKKWTSSA